MRRSASTNKSFRQRIVAWALAMTTNTPLAPQRYERKLLARYERGELTIDRVLELLEASIYQVLYYSRATQQPTESQLQELLEELHRYNAHYQITGLLLYGNGYYVHMLEGAEQDVQTLYAKIQQDARHQQVVTVRQGLGPKRQFTDWHMDFGQEAANAVAQALQVIQNQALVPALSTTDPRLQTLVRAFGAQDGDDGVEDT
jgi:hypothetical protein